MIHVMFRRSCVLSMTLTGPRDRNCCLNEWSSGLVVAWCFPCLVIQTRKGSGEVVFEEQVVGGMLGAATIAELQGRET